MNNILELEKKLFEPEIRSSVGELDRLIADDFIEIGSSGKQYTKQDILVHLPHEKTEQIKLTNPKYKILSHNLMMIIYQAEKLESHQKSFRSSI